MHILPTKHVFDIICLFAYTFRFKSRTFKAIKNFTSAKQLSRLTSSGPCLIAECIILKGTKGTERLRRIDELTKGVKRRKDKMRP